MRNSSCHFLSDAAAQLLCQRSEIEDNARAIAPKNAGCSPASAERSADSLEDEVAVALFIRVSPSLHLNERAIPTRSGSLTVPLGHAEIGSQKDD